MEYLKAKKGKDDIAAEMKNPLLAIMRMIGINKEDKPND